MITKQRIPVPLKCGLKSRLFARERHGVEIEKANYKRSEGKSDSSEPSSASRKLPRPTPTRRNLCCASTPTLSSRDSATRVNSSQEAGGEGGVWLRVSTRNSAVFNFKMTVLAALDSFREASHAFSARRRIMGSVSASTTSCSKVSSAEIAVEAGSTSGGSDQ